MFNEEDSDSEKELKINTGYANNYNSWRQKEELNKLKTKYGEHIKDLESSAEESESSSDEDEDGAVLTEQLEKDFYKTLACLKNKDPKIYDNNVEFFNEPSNNRDDNGTEDGKGSSKKSKKEKKLFLRDYERQIVVERGGKLSDSEDEDLFRSKKRETRAPTYIEEQQALKESISRVLGEDEEEDEEEFGLLKPKAKSEVEKLKEEEAYKEWLKGQPREIDNGEKKALKPLRDFWTDPNLDPKEKFLRDYVLNKKFLDKDQAEENLDYDQIAHDSDENLSEDERNIEKQEEFEHKYNFRFEEPDQEFIKRYPRTLENSLRKKDNRRSQKRAEVKLRKEEDKVRKKEELKQLKALKRKEIADKIAMLKDITGNDDIQFDTVDLEGEFDPAEYDRKMQKIFDEEYYAGPEGNVKPEFPDIDEELGIETTWDDYDPNNVDFVPDNDEHAAENTHCEDPEFNMDADYDPAKALQSELIDASRKKKKRRRSKFAEIIAKEKPKFDPNIHSTYRDYIEQYYALDYEDMIDDLPCRFKYRKVVPNDYGLSIEEILTAEDHELNKWCSLKRALEHKPESMELNEVRAYQQKAKNEEYKKKVFKSLYAPKEEPQDSETVIATANQHDEPAKMKRKKKKKAKGDTSKVELEKFEAKESQNIAENGNVAGNKVPNETKKRKKKAGLATDTIPESKENQEVTKLAKTPVQKLKKRKADVNVTASSSLEKSEEPQQKKQKVAITAANVQEDSEALPKKLKKDKQKKNKPLNDAAQIIMTTPEAVQSNGANIGKNAKKKKKKHVPGAMDGKRKFKKPEKKETDQVALLSSERLKAYGLNPKKFRNKLKYGKQK